MTAKKTEVIFTKPFRKLKLVNNRVCFKIATMVNDCFVRLNNIMISQNHCTAVKLAHLAKLQHLTDITDVGAE